VLAGKTLDSYRICRRLGRGGMAVVYEAAHVESNERVALKMMSHRLVYDQEALDQFQAEADIIQAFDHENVVRLYGRFAAFHTFFIVMEFADGITLKDYIVERGPLPADEFRRSFGQLAGALRYAHEAGIIHRDVKPANVMLARDGAIKLMDFGLATPALGASAGYGKVVGTPRYMAPEQLIGGRLSVAADLFSLGCVGFEMLTGEPLTVEDDVIELLRRHADWHVPELRRDFPHLAADVCQVVEQCLQYEPDDRTLDFGLMAEWAGSSGRSLSAVSGAI
jgi:serine/threonine protein kinase